MSTIRSQRRIAFLCFNLFTIILGLGQKVEGKVLDSFAGIAKDSFPGVVNIRTTSYVRHDPHLDLYEFLLNGRVPQGEETIALGSGVIVDRKGLIVTNYHLIEDAPKIEVLFPKSKIKVEAKILGIDRKTDLALLKVQAPFPLTALSSGDSAKLETGDFVLTIGNPFGFSHVVGTGIVSAMGKVLGTGPYDDFLQIDAAVNPGNSGGALIDTRGRLVGIATAVPSGAVVGGVVIPMNLVHAVIKDLEKYGKVKRAWLGIVGKNILSREDVENMNDPTGVYGVIVSNLIVEGPAYKAGLKIGDLIMGFEGAKVFDLSSIQRTIIQHKPQDKAAIKVYRRTQGFLNVTIPLEEVPPSEDLPSEKDLF